MAAGPLFASIARCKILLLPFCRNRLFAGNTGIFSLPVYYFLLRT
jgi:hypothetical protein